MRCLKDLTHCINKNEKKYGTLEGLKGALGGRIKNRRRLLIKNTKRTVFLRGKRQLQGTALCDRKKGRKQMNYKYRKSTAF